MKDCTDNPDFAHDCTANSRNPAATLPQNSNNLSSRGKNCGKVAAPSPLYLSNLSEKDKPWDQHRAEADLIEQMYYEVGHLGYSNRINECSRWLQFALQNQDSGEVKFKLSDARFCRMRYCPVCQWRKSMKWRARFLNALPKISADYPKHRWLFLTLTVRNCPIGELRSTIQQMGRAWTRLSQKKTFPAVGFVKTTEVTRSDSGEAHPHFHVLLLVKSSYFTRGYIKQEKWVELWKDSLKVDYSPSVNVKSIKTDLDKAILECLKYSVKPQDLIADSEWLDQLTRQMDGTRNISVGGVLRDYIKEDEPENLLDIDEEDEQSEECSGELKFDWSKTVNKYVKR